MELPLRFKQFLCRHEFDIADLVGRDKPDGDVQWACCKCNKNFTAHCGLYILDHGRPVQYEWEKQRKERHEH